MTKLPETTKCLAYAIHRAVTEYLKDEGVPTVEELGQLTRKIWEAAHVLGIHKEVNAILQEISNKEIDEALKRMEALCSTT